MSKVSLLNSDLPKRAHTRLPYTIHPVRLFGALGLLILASSVTLSTLSSLQEIFSLALSAFIGATAHTHIAFSKSFYNLCIKTFVFTTTFFLFLSIAVIITKTFGFHPVLSPLLLSIAFLLFAAFWHIDEMIPISLFLIFFFVFTSIFLLFSGQTFLFSKETLFFIVLLMAFALTQSRTGHYHLFKWLFKEKDKYTKQDLRHDVAQSLYRLEQTENIKIRNVELVENPHPHLPCQTYNIECTVDQFKRKSPLSNEDIHQILQSFSKDIERKSLSNLGLPLQQVILGREPSPD